MPCSAYDFDLAQKFVHRCDNSIYLYPAEPGEIFEIIKNLKNKGSCGCDGIPISLIKNCANELAPILTYLINLSLSTGIFPSKLKKALIKPIYKKGEKSNIKNSRPVALLNNLSKIFERVIYGRLMNFFEKYNILSDAQNGFRRKRSTIRATYQALNNILESLNNNYQTITMCLDLSKAFDSVCHRLLLSKLECYGVRGVALQLIDSYLSGTVRCG